MLIKPCILCPCPLLLLLKLPAKMKFHLWRINHNFLPVETSLARYISFIDVSCIICGFHTEDNLDLFRDCPFACATWTRFIPLSTALNYQLFFFSLGWEKWLLFNMNSIFGKGWINKFAIIIWHIWCYRNHCVF